MTNKKKPVVKKHLLSENKLAANNRAYYYILFLFALIFYGNSIRNNYSFDDKLVIFENKQIHQGIKAIPEIFTSHYNESDRNTYGYRPMAKASFALEYQLWKESPHISHFINFLLYSLCCILLLIVLNKIFFKYNKNFNFLIVLLFLAHPVHTEAVDSLKNREELLCFIWCFSSLFFFIKYHQKSKILNLVFGVITFVFAILSKQTALTFAAIIPLAIYYIDENIHLPVIDKFFIKKYLFHFLFIIFYLAAVFIVTYLIMTAIFFGVIILFKKFNRDERTAFIKNKYFILGLVIFIVGFILRVYHFPISGFILLSAIAVPLCFYGISINNYRRFALIILVLSAFALSAFIIPSVMLKPENKTLYFFENPLFKYSGLSSAIPYGLLTLVYYLKILTYPHPLLFYYGYNMIPYAGWNSAWVILSVMFHLFLFIVAIWKLRERHIISFLILFYLITISMFSNMFLKIPGIIGDRLLFLPSVAFSIFTVWLFFKILKIDILKNKIPSGSLKKVYFLSALLIIPYGYKTITRNYDWKNFDTLYAADIKYLSNSAKANSVYADQLTKEIFDEVSKTGNTDKNKIKIEEALEHYKRTLDIYPDFPSADNNIGTIYVNLLQRFDLAIPYFKNAAKIDSLSKEAFFNLAFSYDKCKNTVEALKNYSKAYNLDSTNLTLITCWADLAGRTGDFDKAIFLNKKIIMSSPASDKPYLNIGNYYCMKNDTASAIAYWEKAIQIVPANFKLNTVLYKYFKRRGDTKKYLYYYGKSTIVSKGNS